MQYRKQTNKGLIKAIVVIVIALLVISYYGLNLRDIVNKPTAQDNFSYVQEQAMKTWGTIKGPVTYVWKDIIVKSLVSGVIDHIVNSTSTRP